MSYDEYAIEWSMNGTTMRVEAPTRETAMKMFDDVSGAKTCSCGPDGACDRCGGKSVEDLQARINIVGPHE
ncbi:hypothetical protein HRTV-28_gp31 [Halorubrum tailed virus 28]|uniref:Uncharacterized protein n=1 Tax=Halorubrum tailed virus 28 TaxID=2878009 RepID=A0AAE9BYZ1_9CAUD|nr:hypothetical protein M1M39_gp32 [Halorubrum tailed virus 28]UBF23469.1 hypothetical protein HRTV-28_gp31 [Halorubrum tailed virus 28]